MKNDKMKFELQSDLDLISKGMPSQRVVELALKAPEMRVKKERPSLNLALVIDHSGSMRGDKLRYAREALKHLIGLLKERDHATLVAYDTQVDVLASALPVTDENRRKLLESVRSLEAGSMTNLSGGWLTGCQQAAEVQGAGRLSRALLLSDGLANVGITELEELGHHAAQMDSRGISTSTFGVGLDFNEHLMEQMANQGGGNFYFIEHPNTISQIFADEFAMLASMTARDVTIEVRIPHQVQVEVPGGWKQKLDNDLLTIHLGDLAAGQTREVYLRLLTPPHGMSNEMKLEAILRYTDEDGAAVEMQMVLALYYAEQEAVDAGVLKADLMERYSVVEVADAANEALKLEREGRRDEAVQLMESAVAMNMPYMPAEEVNEYRNLSVKMADGLEERERKATNYSTYQKKQRRQR